MNHVINLYERQYGNYFSRAYDTALLRLAAHRTDSWKGVSPTEYAPDFNPNPPLLAAKFAKKAGFQHVLAIANEDGKVAIQDVNIRNGQPEECALEGEQCHFNAVFDVEWMPSEMKLVSVSGDHTAKLWQLTESQMRETRVFKGHTRSVKTAAFRPNDQSVFATGGRDGAILIWDTRASHNVDLTKADNCIYSGHAGGPGTPVSQRKRNRNTPKLPPNVCSSSITGLIFQDDTTLISCGAGDGVIKIWDMRRNYSVYKKEPLPKYSLPYAGMSTLKGFTNLSVDSSGLRLYANCMDNHIYCYNISTYSPKPLQCYKGLKVGTFYIKSCLSPDGQYLLSGSSDEKAYVWNLDQSNPLLALNGHTVEVTCVAWSIVRGEHCLVTCSDDARHKIWRIINEEGLDNDVDIRGRAEQNFLPKMKMRKFVRSLEFTPRSIKRLVDHNEKTPTVEKNNQKRSIEDGGEAFDTPDMKRQTTESRGRRLFSPISSTPSDIHFLEIAKGVQIIFDENLELPKSPTALKISKSSPLSERINCNLMEMPSTSSSNNSLTVTTDSATFSLTSNLPNFVIDGDAPHLRISSPKRKLKENVDWLTRIRKQKVLNAPSPSSEKNSEAARSPRLQQLRNDGGSNLSVSPQNSSKRRLSHSGQDGPNPKTPRRSSTAETSILRFFSVTPTNSAATNSK